MSNQCLTKQFIAEVAINPNTFVKFGSADDFVVQAANATDPVIGVFEGFGANGAAANERVDEVLVGIADVKVGGTVARGGEVTANAAGLAVASAPAVGTNGRIAGILMASAVVNDIAPVLLSPGLKQG